MDLLADLNERQKEAVLATEGPVMVMAGAGSGKTRVLTRRIAHIILNLGIAPSNILAVTFTNKAAFEMKERVNKLLGIDTRFMWISTFHSFCARLLRIEARYLGNTYTSNFQILDDDDSLKIVKQVVKKLNIEDVKPQTLRGWISKAKNFADFSLADPIKMNIFTKVKDEYDLYLMNNNAFDFDDLLIKTVEILKNNEDLLEKYQAKFNYILVDEFQDTNKIQFDLIYLLAAQSQNIFVVGDEDQSIYSFRGALVTNIKKFRQVFPLTKLILLEENYRSSKAILDLANKVIRHNPGRIEKKLFTKQVESIRPYYFKASTSYEETLFVLEKIKELLDKGYEYKDFAVMYRANYISRNFEDIFVKNKIPYAIYGGLSFFSRKEIKDVVAYLRLILNSDDNLSFLRIVNEPKRKIGAQTLEKLDEVANLNKVSLFNAIPNLNNTNLSNFYKMISDLSSQVNDYDLEKFYDLILDKTGYLAYLKANDEEDRIENVNEFRSVLSEALDTYEGSNQEVLAGLLQDLSLRTDTDNKKDSDEVVKLMTFHQAKGLEFKVVFMVAMEEGIFPSINAITEADLEEERRICYVGVTRAKERLYISSCNLRLMYGKEDYHMPSRFIREMGLVPTTKPKRPETRPESPKIQGSKQIPTKKYRHPYQVGDKISHKVFGVGLVVDCDDTTITVAFPVPNGIKKLMANHPSIAKIED